MKTLSSFIKLGVCVAIPIALVAIPTSLVESGRSICLFKNLIGHECPGCGITRAISCVFHGQFARAIEFNKLVIVVFPLLCLVWLKYALKELRNVRQRLAKRQPEQAMK